MNSDEFRAAIGRVPSSPSAADARAIDRELEARYGGRPTVTPDGRIVNLTSAAPPVPLA